ncbi:MAG TPA: sulfotransferase [Fimbriimonas sp.]|nr:sulfotransferase [Fimbriimonas sp.]
MSDARSAQAAGRWDQVEKLAAAAHELNRSEIMPRLMLGMVAARQQKVDQAIGLFEGVAKAAPNTLEAVFWLALLYRQVGRIRESIDCAERAIELNPREANLHSNLGLTFMAAGQPAEAVSCFQKAAELNPKLAPNWHQLGKALQLQSRDAEAVEAFRRAIELAPNSSDSVLSLGQSLLNLDDFDGAIEFAKRVLTLNPSSSAGHLLLAGALIEQGRSAEADPHLRKTVELDPNDSQARAMLGMRFQALGQMDSARQEFEEAIRIQPKQGFGYSALMQNRKASESDRPLMARMEEMLADHGISPRSASYLHYGLGKAHEDLKEFGPAMRHFDEANRLVFKLKFGSDPLNRTDYAASVDWIIGTFTKDFFLRYRRLGAKTDLPIFIVGMMRSGTTLAEQILSSHPGVEATGEQRFWTARAPEMLRPDSPTLREETVGQLAGAYIERLRSLVPDAPHATDKMPGNYMYLGPIHLALPNARIIHTKRNPIDTCISIYATPNRAPNIFAHNKDNIVFAYEQYLRLMEHWRRVLPADRFLEVSYEQLVTDREAETRKILEFCGLEWDQACLFPEQNERAVVTPSVWQVRQPVYTTSMERWRNYEPWLGDFNKLRKHL